MKYLQDVVVIGGGPAGSTTASYLAKKGHTVTVLEKEKFPRIHVGESLLPFCYAIFQELGVLDQMKNRFVRKPTVRFISDDGKTSTNWCFNHVIKDESYLSFQVERSEFDTILLENSRKCGATVEEQTKVRKVDFDSDSDTVQVYATGANGEEKIYKTRFLIDASGRSSFIATKNGWRKPHREFERTALWTHWKNVKSLKGGLEEGASLIMYIGGEKRGWSWIFPLGLNQVTAGVVMDSSYLRHQKQEAFGNSQDWASALYLQELLSSEFTKDLLQDAKMAIPIQVEGDYSYYSENKFGARYALVGDAGRFIDPIFSSGVYLSMKSGSLVANALHKMLDSNNLDDNTPLKQVYETINGAYDLVYRLICLYYNPHSVSFAEAGSFFDLKQKEHEDAMAAAHYMLAGDFFENNVKYHKYLDLFANPRQFDFYRDYVIEREELHTPCNTDVSIIFPAVSLGVD
jgi:flavin-dependent dehydrogenase